jgi:L-fuconolactonase
MQIIDTHIHVWDLSKAKYDWLEGDTSTINRTFTINEIESNVKELNIIGGVLVQAACNLDDTNLMLEIAKNTSWIKGVVGWLPLMQPNTTKDLLENTFLQNTFYKGVRHLIHDEKDSKWLLQDQVLESLEILANKNLTFDVVGILPDHLECVLEVQKQIPHLKMVLDHLNAPPISTNQKYGKWGELLQEVAKCKNVFIKISGLGTASGNFNNRTTADILPYVQFAIQHFGIERTMCGGDWPVSTLANNYTNTWLQIIDLIKQTVSNENEQQKIFHTNAVQFYKLN